MKINNKKETSLCEQCKKKDNPRHPFCASGDAVCKMLKDDFIFLKCGNFISVSN